MSTFFSEHSQNFHLKSRLAAYHSGTFWLLPIGAGRSVENKRLVYTSVLLAERDVLGAELLSGALKRSQSYFEVVSQCLTSAEAIRHANDLNPKLALVSIQLKDGETAGYSVLAHLRDHLPATRGVALMHESKREFSLEAFRQGARGVISRGDAFRLIAKCLRKVDEGEIWANSDQIAYVFDALKREAQAIRRPSPALERLTPRERDVVLHVSEGMRNVEIGEKLGVSEHTVRNYIMKIYDKLGVSNRVQLSRQCAELVEK